MKKLFLFLILVPSVVWAGHFGSSTKGKEATVSWSYISVCDSAWMVFGYDGDAGDADTTNMYDSLKLVQCFSGTGKELCADGLDLDSIGSHVVRMYCFSGDAVIGIRVGKWEQKTDSAYNAIEDANKANFKATGFSIAGDPMTLQSDSLYTLLSNLIAFKDSIENAITATNKANFKATGFAVTGDPMTLQSDSLYTLLSNLIAFKDSVENSIVAANKANFKATGFSIAGDPMTLQADTLYILLNNLIAFKDSVENAITDPNKANFKFGGGADSVRAHLATHDSTLQELAAACGDGSGTYACTVEVRDSTLQAGIQGVTVAIRNHASTATVKWSTTNADGKAFFGLDTLQTGNSYKPWLQQLSYNFTFPETLDIRGDTTVVYYGTAFEIGDPPADSTCAVFDQIFDPQLDSLSGVKICFWLEAPADSLIVYNGAIFSPYEVCTTTTVNGRWRLDLMPESLFHRPAGLVYWKAKISYPISHGGIIVEYDSVSVPVATQVNADEILH